MGCDMRDFRDSKAMAQSLRQALSDRSVTVTHSESLELIAKTFALDNWNILAAKIEAARPPEPQPATEDGPKTLYCSFCGKSQHDVQSLIAGPSVFICNECVGLCDGILIGQRIRKDIAAAVPHAAAAEALSAYADDELLASQRGMSDWLDHLEWSVSQADAALAGEPGAPWRPDETAAKRGWTRDPNAGKSRDEIRTHRANLERQQVQIRQSLDVVRQVLSERGIAL
jgi:hypothetical protein